MDEIQDGCFVGTVEDAGNGELLRAHDISAVVSLTYSEPEAGVPEAVAVERVPMMDGPRNDADAFNTAVSATLERLAANERVLVHCSAGASRSVAVVAAALAIRNSWTSERAFDLLAARRGAADPHPSLRRRATAVVERAVGR